MSTENTQPFGFTPAQPPISNTPCWRSAIPRKFFAPNMQALTDEEAKLLEQGQLSVDTLPDNKLLLLLAGVKYIAKEHGYSKVDYTALSVLPDFVSVKCTIVWENPRLDVLSIEFSALADAHKGNTSGFARDYLTAMAENRAFSRCVRNFLGIDVLTESEIYSGSATQQEKQAEIQEEVKIDPLKNLKETMKKYKIKFAAVKALAIQQGIEGADRWSTVDDIAADINKVVQVQELLNKPA